MSGRPQQKQGQERWALGEASVWEPYKGSRVQYVPW